MKSLAVLAALAGGAEATPAKVDWAANQVTAVGVGIADRHAPSPAVARGTSRRGAEDAARQAIAAALPAIPMTNGRTLGDALADPGVKARVDAAVAGALTVAADPDTDGSWRVTLGVPLEALRVAIAGARELPAGGDAADAPVIIVDGAAVKPALGLTVGGQRVAVWWARSVPAFAKRAPHVRAIGAKGGDLAVEGHPAIGPGTLVVVITRS